MFYVCKNETVFYFLITKHIYFLVKNKNYLISYQIDHSYQLKKNRKDELKKKSLKVIKGAMGLNEIFRT